ncbi:MAG: class I SAM-dependent methyltransferase [Pseudonocardia sp.]
MRAHPDRRAFVPAMGRDGLLPLYDVVARLAGARGIYRAVLDAAALRPGMRVVDIGCGTGTLAVAAGRHPDVEVVGLDPDDRVLARARGKAARAGVTVRFDQGYAQELPYPDGSYDRVLSSLMLHHLGRGAKTGMLDEVRRVLAPGGQLVLADIDGPVGVHALLARRRPRPHPGHDADAVDELLAAAGLAATRIGRVPTRLGEVAVFRAGAG